MATLVMLVGLGEWPLWAFQKFFTIHWAPLLVEKKGNNWPSSCSFYTPCLSLTVVGHGLLIVFIILKLFFYIHSPSTPWSPHNSLTKHDTDMQLTLIGFPLLVTEEGCRTSQLHICITKVAIILHMLAILTVNILAMCKKACKTSHMTIMWHFLVIHDFHMTLLRHRKDNLPSCKCMVVLCPLIFVTAFVAIANWMQPLKRESMESFSGT